MGGEIIDFCCFGMDLLIRATNTIVYPSEFGIKAYKKKQEKSYLQDS
jgi:hypothetical protein